MTPVIQNTLYVLNSGLYIHRDHLSLRIEENRELKMSLPIHNLESILIFGHTMVSPSAMKLCWENDVSINFLDENGRLQARVEGVPRGSVMLRRNQHEIASDPIKSQIIVRNIIAGKLRNSIWLIQRTARECSTNSEVEKLKKAVSNITTQIRLLTTVDTIDALRGFEGMAATHYFEVFELHLKSERRKSFSFKNRNKRPPRDRMNCVLSFLYALLRHDCVSALTAIGLDPFVGFLHADRPGRESLALDLMEEFRPFADRMAITLINRGELQEKHFKLREGGAVELTDSGRKSLVQGWQKRKQDEIKHPLLKHNCRMGQIPFMQARIMARIIRGDLPEYIPYLYK